MCFDITFEIKIIGLWKKKKNSKTMFYVAKWHFTIEKYL